MATMTRNQMVEAINAGGMGLYGKNIDLGFKSANNRVFRGKVSRVTQGEKVLRVEVVFNWHMPPTGRWLHISGDSFDDLISDDITFVAVGGRNTTI